MKITSVIQCDSNNKTLIWKHPEEDFNTMSQLIVQQSQEAIFCRDGRPLDLFGPGRYTLSTQNIPILGKLLNLVVGGVSPFHCEVYFINKVEQMAVKWGTDSRIQYMEPTYRFPISIGASGEMSLRVVDSRKLLLKLVGTEAVLSQQNFVRYFQGVLMTRIKSYIAQIMKSETLNIFEIDEKLVGFSEELHGLLTPDFADYGVGLERFFVTTVSRPDGEAQYEKFKELHFRRYADVAEAELRQQVGVIDEKTKAEKLVIESGAIAQKRAQEGYTYQQERGFDVAEKIAGNEGTGSFSSAGIGLGMMAGVGGAVGNAVGGVFNRSVEPVAPDVAPQTRAEQGAPDATEATAGFCDHCGVTLVEGAAFCDACGTGVVQAQKRCAQCGTEFVREGRFCPSCGAKREG